MIRETDPSHVLPRRSHDDFDLPPCVMDESGYDGELGEPDDPLHDERNGTPKSRKHVMHDKEREEE